MTKSELTDSKGRAIYQLMIDAADHPDDGIFTSGCYEDGSPVSAEELQELNMLYPEVIKDMWYDKQPKAAK